MKFWLIAIGIFAATSPVLAEDFTWSRFRALRGEAVQAVNTGDFATAERALVEARTLLPSAPSVLLLGAQIELAAGKPDAAKTFLAEYIRRGLWFDVARYPDFAPLLDETLTAGLAANGTAFGTFEIVKRYEGLVLIEDVAVNSGGQVFVSTVHTGALNELRDSDLKTMRPFDPGSGAYGLAIRDGQIFVASTPGPVSQNIVPPIEGVSGLFHVDTRLGGEKWYPDSSGTRAFGDVAMGRTEVYASDTKNAEVVRLERNGSFAVVVARGRLGSPQGLAESADGKRLIVADYSSGLYRVDLASGAIGLLDVPADASLVGIDGVERYGDDLIVVQNGIKPARVLRIHLSSDWQKIESVEVLLRGGGLDEPTGGQVAGDKFIFVARSQWSDFDDAGQAFPDAGPAIIGELKLEP